MPDSQVKLVITTDSTGAVTGINGVTTGLKKMESETGGIASKIKTHWLGLTAAVAGSMAMISQAWTLADTATQFEEQMGSLDALAVRYGTTASSIVGDIQAISKGMIDQASAAGIAAEGLMKGMSPEQMIKLSEASETFSNVTGRKVVDIMSELSEALETGKMRALKMQLGIIDLDAVYGNAVSTMTEAEKAQAMYNIVLEKSGELQKILGNQTDSMNDKMEQASTRVKDYMLNLGQVIARVAQGLVGVAEWIAGVFNAALAVIPKAIQGIGWLIEKLPGLNAVGKSMKDWGRESSAAFAGSAGDLFSKGWDTMKGALGLDNSDTVAEAKKAAAARSAAVVAEEKASLKKLQDALSGSLKTNLTQYEKYYTDLKKMQDDYKAKIEKSLKEIAEIDKKMLESRRSTQELLYQIGEKANPAANEMEAYNRKAARLDQDLTYALTLSGEERIKSLQDYQKAWGDMVQQIDYTEIERKFSVDTGDWSDVEVKKTWLSLGDSAKTASERIQQAGQLIEQTQQEMRAEAEAQLAAQVNAFNMLSDAVTMAESWVAYLKQTIDQLDKGLVNPRTLSIDCTAALAELDKVIEKMQFMDTLLGGQVVKTGGLGGAPGVGGSFVSSAANAAFFNPGNWAADDIYSRNIAAGNANNIAAYDLGYGGGYNYDGSPQVVYLDSFAKGTDYVPRTGLYKLHQGESVNTAAETKNGQATRSMTINVGGITINGTDKDAKQLARELAPAIRTELKRLEYIG